MGGATGTPAATGLLSVSAAAACQARRSSSSAVARGTACPPPTASPRPSRARPQAAPAAADLRRSVQSGPRFRGEGDSDGSAGRKLFQPSYGFNLTDPYCRILENQYNSLHDPHLRAYHQRKDILGRLKKGGYITNNNEVVCSLKEFNKYREYLRSLKLDFEKNCIKEQNQALPEKEMASHLPKIQENVFKRKEIKKNTFVYRGQDGTHSSRKKEKKTFDDVKVASAVGDQRANKGVNESFEQAANFYNITTQTTGEWIKKIVTYQHNGIHLRKKKDQIKTCDLLRVKEARGKEVHIIYSTHVKVQKM
ncbi:fibrous sheath-interacting protein 2 isoform X5 [Manis javanica]|uniref:fibrous sheath-interacting protein 2 isoform X5 n=1 Tax=Manis javanica TaxID=9974 RepID=UPI003C6D85CC